jgi:transposase
VDTLDMAALGFAYTDVGSALGGQPGYPPSAILKLYLYGYENKIRSSRLLEREAARNVELMWLLQGFTPSHAAIANFRKNNLKALKNVNRDFVRMCRELNLFGREEVSIDGTFIRGNASKAIIHTQEKLEMR